MAKQGKRRKKTFAGQTAEPARLLNNKHTLLLSLPKYSIWSTSRI